MHEAFDFAWSGCADGLQIFQSGFPGHHRLFHAIVVGEQSPSGISHCHLGTGVERQFRSHLPGHSDHAQILDDDPVHPDVAQKAQIFPQIGHLSIVHQSIHGHIDLHPMKMGELDGPSHFFRPEVLRIGSGPEMAASQVHRVGSGEDSGFQGSPGPGRGQEFDIFSFHDCSFYSFSKRENFPFNTSFMTFYFTIFFRPLPALPETQGHKKKAAACATALLIPCSTVP